MTRGFMLRRKLLAGVAAILMGASLVFSGSASAHNIDLAKAREVARDYARGVRAESDGRYLHYSTNCVSAFPNHNHIVRCLIDYQSAKDKAKGVYTCRESIELKFNAHSVSGGRPVYIIWGDHTSNSKCGNRFLTKAPLG
jgi:hypothetical protein